MSILTLAGVPKPGSVFDGQASLNERSQHRYDQRTMMTPDEAARYREARRRERVEAVREREDLFEMIRNLRSEP